MPIDREAVLKKAEKLLRQGKLAGAIEEYVRLVAVQPRDVGAINSLGDLYARAGDPDRAVSQFVRVGDQLLEEGFLPKAQAIYKKALKVQPHHEHALSQLAEIARQQGRSADALTYLGQLADRMRLRGDDRGAAECALRIQALMEAAWPAPTACTVPAASSAPPEPAATEAPQEEAPSEPASLVAAARAELASGNEFQGRALLMRALTLDTARHGDVVQVALDLAAEGRIETAFGCLDVAADAALLAGNLMQAVDALQSFVRVAPHVPALVKLVELCVDAGQDGPLRAAQTQLADAYLDTGRGTEARVIAEDLLGHDPDCEAHARRLRRAMELLELPDADRLVADIRRDQRIGDELDARADGSQGAEASEAMEIDLTDLFAGIGNAEPIRPGDPFDRALEHLKEGRVEEGMADLREAAKAAHTRAKAAAELGRLYARRGELASAVEWLEQAADGQADTREAGLAVLYELADALERLGEPARALAVLIDLDADAGGYRDVRARIDQLARAQAESQSL